MARLVGHVVDQHGRLDFAHNNAGICPVGYAIDTLTEELWDQVIGVNLKGVWLSMKYELEVMRGQRSGAIVNTSSVCGLRATAKTTPYNTSKHGVIGLTQEAALDFAELGIRVNAVLPGVVDTAMAHGIATQEQIDEMGRATPVGRVAQPERHLSGHLQVRAERVSARCRRRGDQRVETATHVALTDHRQRDRATG